MLLGARVLQTLLTSGLDHKDRGVSMCVLLCPSPPEAQGACLESAAAGSPVGGRERQHRLFDTGVWICESLEHLKPPPRRNAKYSTDKANRRLASGGGGEEEKGTAALKARGAPQG